MSVFNVCLKIFRKNLGTISIYFIVFLFVSTIITILASPQQAIGFGQERINMAFMADEETPVTAGLKDALKPMANFIEIEDDAEKLKEALFYRRVHYILRVPEGFSENFLSGQRSALEKTTAPDSASAVYIDIRIDKFLQTLYMYKNALPGLSLDETISFALEDLAQETKVTLASPETNLYALSTLNIFFNFVAYSIMFSIIFGVSAILLAFNDLDRRRRILISPVAASKISFQCYLACVAYSLANWLALVLLSLAFGFSEALRPTTWLYILNSLIFAVSASGLAFLIGNLAKNNEVVSAVANVLTLGSSFISGVFVPQQLLGENVLRIASFFPTYWYVRANGRIAALSDFSLNALSDIAVSMSIQIAFAAAFVVISLVAVKRKQTAAQ